jgi:hypothetical protein
MAYSLLEASAIGGADPKETAVVELFMQNSPLMAELPFMSVQGRSYTYNQEVALPGVAWRAVNSPWPESTGVINPQTERSYILGGEVKVDNYLLETEPAGGVGLKTNAFRQKVQAASNEFDRSVLEGDQGVDPNQLVGLRRRLTASQVTLQAAGGGPLTLAQLNVMIDTVTGPDSKKLLLMNKTLQRKTTDLVNSFGGSVMLSMDTDKVGTKYTRYRGVRIGVVEQLGDASTYLDFDEDPGDGTSDTASIYCIYMDEADGMGAFYTGKKTLSVKDFGEQQSEPRHLGRLEFFVGIYIKQARAAGRLRGITAA